ncbi:unnamed protein product, partial [Cladocopium goreaui]
MQLSTEGVGAAEVEYYRDLGLARRVLLWYSGDTVWHEALLGLIANDECAYIYTPDHDLYLERVSCKCSEGPVKLKGLTARMGLPRNLRARAYRFREAITNDVIKKVFRDSVKLARKKGFEVHVAAEPLGGLTLGQEVSLNAETDVECGDRHALMLRGGDWVKAEMIPASEAPDYADKRRALFRAGVLTGAGSSKDKVKDNRADDAEGDGEVRTLWVDFDEHGERFKRWRDVVKESFTLVFEDRPLEGPSTALHLIQHAERHGGDPRLWLQLWCRSKHIEQTDRTYNAMKVLCDALYMCGTFDQVNIPALMSMETICRRIQAIVDAYSNPNRPSWENAKLFSGQGTPEDIVQKVRELRGSPAVHVDDGDGSDALPVKPKSPKKSKEGKGGGQPVGCSRGVRQRRNRIRRVIENKNEVIFALNWMAGAHHLGDDDFSPCSLMDSVVQRVDGLVEDQKPSGCIMRKEESLKAILKGGSPYDMATINDSLASYQPELVSVPADIRGCPDLSTLLPPSDRHFLEEKTELMIKAEGERVDPSLTQPYWDPKLKYNRKSYFAWEPIAAHVVGLTGLELEGKINETYVEALGCVLEGDQMRSRTNPKRLWRIHHAIKALLRNGLASEDLGVMRPEKAHFLLQGFTLMDRAGDPLAQTQQKELLRTRLLNGGDFLTKRVVDKVISPLKLIEAAELNPVAHLLSHAAETGEVSDSGSTSSEWKEEKGAKKRRPEFFGTGQRQPTRQGNYDKKWQELEELARPKRVSFTNPGQVDRMLVDLFNAKYFEGEGSHYGDYVMASLMDRKPDFGKLDHLKLSRAWRSMKCWRKLCPSRSRLAYPLAVWCGISWRMVELGHVQKAVFNLIQLSTYHRPGALLKLRKMGLVPPTSGVTGFWSIVTSLTETSDVSKTGSKDPPGLKVASVPDANSQSALQRAQDGSGVEFQLCGIHDSVPTSLRRSEGGAHCPISGEALWTIDRQGFKGQRHGRSSKARAMDDQNECTAIREGGQTCSDMASSGSQCSDGLQVRREVSRGDHP